MIFIYKNLNNEDINIVRGTSYRLTTEEERKRGPSWTSENCAPFNIEFSRAVKNISISNRYFERQEIVNLRWFVCSKTELDAVINIIETLELNYEIEEYTDEQFRSC